MEISDQAHWQNKQNQGRHDFQQKDIQHNATYFNDNQLSSQTINMMNHIQHNE
jgi:hypothetical protein